MKHKPEAQNSLLAGMAAASTGHISGDAYSTGSAARALPGLLAEKNRQILNDPIAGGRAGKKTCWEDVV
jgi:hypothetical protein